MTSRNELLQLVEQQKHQLTEYETKLKNVIRAYKGIIAEKEALEASLNALAPSTQVVTDAEGAEPPEVSVGATDERLVTLQRAIATLSAEKRSLEEAYRAEKKDILKEKEQMHQRLEEKDVDARKARQIVEQQLNEVRAQVRQIQAERECEQSDHAAQIRELQSRLTQKRFDGDHSQKQVMLLQSELADSQRATAEFERQAGELRGQIDRLKKQITEYEAKQREAMSLAQLEAQLAAMRANHEEELADERRRVVEAERALAGCARQAEDRVARLESRVTELTGAIALCEKQRGVDTAQIEKLKKKLNRSPSPPSVRAVESGESTDEALIGRFIDRVSDATFVYRLTERVGSEQLTVLLGLHNDEHTRCREERDALRAEIARLSAAAMKAKSTPLPSPPAVDDRAVRVEREKLRAELECVRSSLMESEARSRDALEELRAANAREVASVRAEAEAEAAKQRERTQTLLAEMERELREVRARGGEERRAESRGTPVEDDDQRSETGSAVFAPPDPPAASQAAPLYYADELARKERELNALHRKRRELDARLSEVQQAAIVKELQLHETIEVLKEQLRRRDVVNGGADEGAHNEYLKNVLLQFLCADASSVGKANMLKAIGVALKLTPKEMEQLTNAFQRSNGGSWWPKTK